MVHDELLGYIPGNPNEGHAYRALDVEQVVDALAEISSLLSGARQERESVRVQGEHDVAVGDGQDLIILVGASRSRRLRRSLTSPRSRWR
ncbi:hypothetical protein GT030_20620 [Streptomyces sp. SID1328]|uniref:hypothetical protein n=1 Tax=Streptomyces sp. SID1328 TaxID=2690250 RepID=UPI00136839F2|nr:hypothetical protein [Streptomyces sp. SID1328]MYV41205.1 hypothetical protein [Streptomyces sp. SID1328]